MHAKCHLSVPLLILVWYGSRKERLTRFHAPWHPHYLARPFAVAADSDWSPDGSQIMGLVITNRPETRRRGSGIIVLIDLPTR